MWYTSFIEKIVLKTFIYVGVVATFAIFLCFVFTPNWFDPKCVGVVDRIDKESIVQHLKLTSAVYDVYYFKIRGGDKFYTYNIEAIDQFGINNIVGHKISFKYKEEIISTYGYRISELNINHKRIFPDEYADTKGFLFLLLVAIFTSAWTIWGFIINYRKTGNL
ncbi:MAG TPA: hypothetical protein VMV56_03615 [Williamwhitmania sp.]|nr:hypothetical protein [Williamwhitmania sp.]